MNLVKFPVASTRIFPVANSTIGGQLLTEVNQLSRETVANHSIIPYECGPSYTHSLNDFKISAVEGTHVITISEGIAIVHGHFIKLDTPISIDISVENAAVSASNRVSGQVCIGLRAMYSNSGTVAAALQTDDGSMQDGIQVVILNKNKFYLPEDNGTGNYTPEDQVTAHLKLGDFNYSSTAGITNVVPNVLRHTCLDGERISNIDALLSNTYVDKTGLDSEKLYLFSGGSNDWTNATDSTIIWDANPQTFVEGVDPVKSIWRKDSSSNELLLESAIRYDYDTDQLKMVLPHKQVEGMQDTSGNTKLYKPKEVIVPAANRATGAGGVLDASWVNFLNGLDDKIATMYRMPGGKMRKFISVLTDKSQLPAPPIGYYTEQTRNSAYYDNRLQYSFNLLQTQVAQLYSKFVDFQSKLESEWKDSVAADVSANLSEQNNLTQANLESMRTTLANFQGDLSGIVRDIANSSAELTAHLQAYNDVSNRVTVLENRWLGETGSPTSTDADQNAQIQILQTKVTTLQTEVDSINTSTSNLIENIESQLNTLFQNLYGANKDGSSGDVRDSMTSIEQLRSQYDYLYDAIHDLYNGINSEVQKATDSLKSELNSALNKDIEAQIAAIAEQYNVSAEWKPGDYVLVAQDQTIVSDVNESTATFPSTMYVVVPGMTPLDSKYVASYYDVYTTDLSTPINRVYPSSSSSGKDVYNEALDTYSSAVATLKRQVPGRFIYGYELGGNDVQELNSEDDLPDVYNSTIMLDELYNSTALMEGVRGVPGKDYFVLRYRYPINDEVLNDYTDEITGQTYSGIQCKIYRWVSVFFTLNIVSDKIELDTDNPIILSGGTPYAEDDRVGGFLNVSSDVYGGGYVSRDAEGHLKLNDFEFLAAGVSAYQLGEDRSEGAGLDISDLQDVFDQYINQRIAFPNDAQLYKAAENNLRTDVITIDLNIGSTAEGTLNIYDIDSRFNTAVHLKISGSATENVLINIKNCQRLRISLDATSSPVIVLDNVCLYYDADVIDRIAQIDGLSLWYMQYEDTDPELEVDGMTVIYQGTLEPKGTERYWTTTSNNDNSYAYALRQLTFASDGTIIGMGVAVTDNTTATANANSESIFASTFTLPQSIGFAYPVTRLKKQLKVTGDFITAYKTTQGSSQGYLVKDTNFTILTQKYLTYTTVKEWVQGVISFFTRTHFVADVQGVDENTLVSLNPGFAIDGWESGAYHIFYGGAID